jgi:CDGSH-type Zn-finger protein
MTEAVIAARAPMGVEVEAGKTYHWCTCGKSSRQPFCDGSHKGGSFSPKVYVPTHSGKVWLCACKRTHKAPLCDGTHKTLG